MSPTFTTNLTRGDYTYEVIYSTRSDNIPIIEIRTGTGIRGAEIHFDPRTNKWRLYTLSSTPVHEAAAFTNPKKAFDTAITVIEPRLKAKQTKEDQLVAAHTDAKQFIESIT